MKIKKDTVSSAPLVPLENKGCQTSGMAHPVAKAFLASGYAIKNQMKKQLKIDPEVVLLNSGPDKSIGFLLFWMDKKKEKVLRFELPIRMIDFSYTLELLGK